jgi:hemerythrin
MQIEWKEELATGNGTIDAQHKELIVRINDLVVACTQGKGREEVGRLLQFMGDYVRSHFATEEELQLQYDYPEFAAHKAEHHSFVQQLRELEQQFVSAGATLPLVIQTNQSMVGWLITHINGTDKKLATFLRSAARDS